jgi:hypothetical protein
MDIDKAIKGESAAKQNRGIDHYALMQNRTKALELALSTGKKAPTSKQLVKAAKKIEEYINYGN